MAGAKRPCLGETGQHGWTLSERDQPVPHLVPRRLEMVGHRTWLLVETSLSQHLALRVPLHKGLVLDTHTHIWSEDRAELHTFEGALTCFRDDWWIPWSSHVSEADGSVGGGE